MKEAEKIKIKSCFLSVEWWRGCGEAQPGLGWGGVGCGGEGGGSTQRQRLDWRQMRLVGAAEDH